MLRTAFALLAAMVVGGVAATAVGDATAGAAASNNGFVVSSDALADGGSVLWVVDAQRGFVWRCASQEDVRLCPRLALQSF
jgi:photosystem II stability/assembly factor-like uncharacterized protein